MVNKSIIIFWCAVSFLCGCAREEYKIVVDDRGVTRVEYERLLALNCACFRILKENATSCTQTEEDYREKRGEMLIGEMLNAYLLDREAKARGLVPTREEIAKAKAAFLDRLQKPGEKKPVKELMVEMGETDDYISALMAQDLRREMLLNAECSTITNVTAKDLQDAKAKLAKAQSDAAASNALQRVRLEKAMARVRAGEKFEKVAEDFERDQVPLHADFKPDGQEWGEFEMADLDGEEFKTWLRKAKTGEIGGPFDVDDGLSVVKLLSMTDGTEEASEASEKVKTFRLARIKVEAYDAEETPDDATLSVWIKNLYHRQTMQRLLKKFQEESHIEVNKEDAP